MNILLRDYESVWPNDWHTLGLWVSMTTFYLKINVGHCDLYFLVQWFYLISWRLFDIWTPYFGIMSQYDPMFDLKIFIAHCDIFHGPVILPYILKTVQWLNIILWDYESVRPDIWPPDICRSLLSWRLFDVWPSYFGIMSQYGKTFDLKINVGHWDLYFMVQQFCLISWIVFDGCMSYFRKISLCNTTFDLKINLGHSDLYFMVQWFLHFYILLWKTF